MARNTPFVREGLLTLPDGQAESIPVGSAAWWAWLADEQTTSFRFTTAGESFTARREHKPGGWYWYAYRRQAGRLHKLYLGRAADLTLERLANAATSLARGRPSTNDQRPTTNDQRLLTHDPQLQAPTPQPGHILTTKLYIPPARLDVVPRPRLRARLDAGVMRTLTLISAPAGSGKTTLLSEWLASQGGGVRDRELNRDVASPNPQLPAPNPRSVAWLSLDAADSDMVQFLRYLIAALQTIAPASGVTTLALLQAPRLPALETLLTTLLNDLVALPHESILVLDDYHVLQSLPVHEAVGFLLDHLPPQLHLVIASREDPPLPLARLRARRQLTELRAADLRFTPAEAAAFLTEVMRLPLSATDVEALEARTEGWIAGLQLAALSIEDHTDVASFMAAFTGSHRYILDYLAEEVLQRQPEEIQTFLLQTSILDRLCGPLCDAVLGDQGWGVGSQGMVDAGFPSPGPRAPTPGPRSQVMLRQIERANLFLVPLDAERQWYRYHHLFAEQLRTRLWELQPELSQELYRRAAAWCEVQGLIDEALRYALAANDHDHAAQMVETHALPAMKRGDVVTIRSWLARLGEPAIRARPRLALVHGWALVMAGDMAPIAARVAMAEQALAHLPDPPSDLVGEIAALQGYMALYKGELPRSIALLKQALAALPEDAPAFGAAAYALGDAYYFSGDLAPASATFALAVNVSRTHGNHVVANVALSGLGNALMLQGRLREAAATAAEGLALASQEGAQQVTTVSNLHANLGKLHYEWNELETALRHLLIAQEIGKLGEYRMLLMGVAEDLAHLHQARGDAEGVRAALEEVERLASGTNDPWRATMAATYRVKLDLGAVGSASPTALAAATRWAEASGLGPDDPLSLRNERGHLMLARVLLHTAERRADGLRLLERLLAAAETAGRIQRVIAILALQAVGLAAQGEVAAALNILQRALTLAEPEGYVRTFVDEGAPMAALLHQGLGDRSWGLGDGSDGQAVRAYARRLLEAFPAAGGGRTETIPASPPSNPRPPIPAPLVEPLTPRERDVLRLLAEGLSGPEIAKSLIVSLSTVQTHLKSLYGKLDAHSRWEAVARARELHLL